MRFQPVFVTLSVTLLVALGVQGSAHAEMKIKSAPPPIATKKTVIGNGQVVITAPDMPQGTMNERDMKEASAMSEMYTRHIFQATCAEKNANLLRPTHQENKPNMTKESLKKACDCQINTLLKDYTPSEITDYISFSKGSAPNSRTVGVGFTPNSDFSSAEDLADIKAEPTTMAEVKQSRSTFSKIAQFLSTKEEKKKCGFIR